MCRDCAAVQELPAATVDDLTTRLLQEHGFVLDVGHAALFGTCAARQGAASRV